MKRNFRYDNKFKIQNSKFKVAFMLMLAFISSCEERKEPPILKVSKAEPSEIYYCPMHPEIQQNHPGKCPKPECKKMELVKKIADDVLNMALKPVNSYILSTTKTIRPEEKEIAMNIETQGFIDYDNNTEHNIASRYNGRIEKLYIKYNYQKVYRGDPVFEIYSPELLTAQENLVYLLNTDAQEIELLNAAKQKLKLLGFTDEQTTELIQTKKVQNSIPVYSKWGGHIHEMPNERETEKNSMIEGNNQHQNTPELSVKEGMYVSRGQTIFNVVDPHEIVVVLQIRVEDIAKIQLNQDVALIMDETPQMIMSGKINFIAPFLKSGSKTLMVRVNMNNNGHKHKIGTFVKANIKGEAVEGLWIPAKSAVDLGREKIVWLKQDGYFVARKIETGIITKDWIEIYDGITQKDEIAAEAHYLSDSEGFIKITYNE